MSPEQIVRNQILRFSTAENAIENIPICSPLYLWPVKGRNWRGFQIETSAGDQIGYCISAKSETFFGKLEDWFLIGEIYGNRFTFNKNKFALNISNAVSENLTGILKGWPASFKNMRLEFTSPHLSRSIVISNSHRWIIGGNGFLFTSIAGVSYDLNVGLIEGRARLFPVRHQWDGNIWEAAALLFFHSLVLPSYFTDWN